MAISSVEWQADAGETRISLPPAQDVESSALGHHHNRTCVDNRENCELLIDRSANAKGLSRPEGTARMLFVPCGSSAILGGRVSKGSMLATQPRHFILEQVSV
jgi:hypothetical protein